MSEVLSKQEPHPWETTNPENFPANRLNEGNIIDHPSNNVIAGGDVPKAYLAGRGLETGSQGKPATFEGFNNPRKYNSITRPLESGQEK